MNLYVRLIGISISSAGRLSRGHLLVLLVFTVAHIGKRAIAV